MARSELTLDLSRLQNEDPMAIMKIMDGIVRAVGHVMQSRPTLLVYGDTVKGELVKERSKKALDIFVRMRHETEPKWPLAKCLDMLPAALQDEVDGIRWEQPSHDRNVWAVPRG